MTEWERTPCFLLLFGFKPYRIRVPSTWPFWRWEYHEILDGDDDD